MKIRNVFILMAALVSGLYFTGCTEEDGVPTGNPPTSVQVTSLGGNSFGVRWTRATNDVGTNTIVATPSAGGAATEVTGITTSQGTITVPSAGKYMISVKGNDGSNSIAVEWATANRSGVITLHETANPSAGYPSGLILGTPGEASSTAHEASTEGAEQLAIDLVLATDNAQPLPHLSLQGADVLGSGITNGRATKVGKNGAFQVTLGLNGDYYGTGIDGEFDNIINSQPLPGTVSDPYIILVKTADLSPHYARVQIVPQGNGLLWKDVTVGANTYRAIDVIVSYQPMSLTPYVTRPGVLRGFNAPRHNAPIRSTVKN